MMDKQVWYTPTVKCYLPIKRDELLIDAKTQMNPENNMSLA